MPGRQGQGPSGTHWTRGRLMSQLDRVDGVRFRHTTLNGAQFKTGELFISGMFHLICLPNSFHSRLSLKSPYPLYLLYSDS